MKKNIWKQRWERITEFGCEQTIAALQKEAVEHARGKLTSLLLEIASNGEALAKTGICASALANVVFVAIPKLECLPKFDVIPRVKKFVDNLKTWNDFLEELSLEEKYRYVCLYLATMRFIQRCVLKWTRDIGQAEVVAFASDAVVRKPTAGVPRIRDRDAFSGGWGKGKINVYCERGEKIGVDLALSA